MVGSLDGVVQEIMPTVSNVEFANGHLLYLFEQTLMARPFDPKSFELTGNAFPLAEGIYFDAAAFLGVFSATEAGVLAYQKGYSAGVSRDNTVEWRDRGGEILDTIGDQDSYGSVSLSPDQRQAAVTLVDSESGNMDLWLVDLERQIKSRFTFVDGNDWSAVWSPDGSRLAFSSDRGKPGSIYVQSVTGGGEAELLHEAKYQSFPTSWSRDGRYLFFEGWASGGPDTFVLDLEQGGEPEVLASSTFFERAPAISPDGRWLAYDSNESGQFEVYVTAFPDQGRKWQVSVDSGEGPRWNSDGSQIYYQAGDSLVVAEVEGSGSVFGVGEVTTLFEVNTDTAGWSWGASADDERFLTIQGGEQAERSAFEPMTLVLNWQNDLRPQ